MSQAEGRTADRESIRQALVAAASQASSNEVRQQLIDAAESEYDLNRLLAENATVEQVRVAAVRVSSGLSPEEEPTDVTAESIIDRIIRIIRELSPKPAASEEG
jgi:hypothetical protein